MTLPNKLSHLAPVIGHRGACAYAPENTLASFQRAHELGATWVEFDVHMAACGELVIIHDDSVARTTNGTGYVTELTYQQLLELDAGSYFAPEFANQRIPTLGQVINLLGETNMCANIEVKPASGQEIEVVEKTVEVVRHHWPEHLGAPMYSSNSPEVLEVFRKIEDDLIIGVLTSDWMPEWQQMVDFYGAASLHVRKTNLNADRVREVKDAGYGILSYTVNEAAEAKKLFDWGVDAVFSDCPDVILNEINA